jgi:hypothetical protein
MPFIQVTFPMQPRRVRRPIERKLLWYDAEKGKMLQFSGSELRFKFKLDKELSPPKNRLLPEPIIREGFAIVEKADPEDLVDWWEDYQDKDNNASLVMGSISETDAVFDVPDEELDNFFESLKDNDFMYEVLE